MGVECLLDTGPLVAILDRSQESHDRCVEVLEGITGAMLTTEAVLTEATHLLSGLKDGPGLCLEFVLGGGAVLVPATLASLRRSQALVRKYRDVPMDFADATLVTLAEETRVAKVFTLDRRGFSVYRFLGRRPFEVVP